MSVGPYPLAGIITALESLPEIRIVGVCADLAAASERPPQAAPAAFVVLGERADAPHGYTETHVQRVHATVTVVLWVQNYRGGRTGAGAASAMDELDAAIRRALITYRPSGNQYEPLYLRGTQDEFVPGWLMRQVAFQSDYRLQVT